MHALNGTCVTMYIVHMCPLSYQCGKHTVCSFYYIINMEKRHLNVRRLPDVTLLLIASTAVAVTGLKRDI